MSSETSTSDETALNDVEMKHLVNVLGAAELGEAAEGPIQMTLADRITMNALLAEIMDR